LQAGDIITAYNGKPVQSASSIRNEISMMNPGTTVDLTVNRNGRIMHIPVTLGSRSEISGDTSESAQKIGIEVENLSPEIRRKLNLSSEDEGVVITRVKAGSLAAQAGMRPGFLIIAVNHKKVESVKDFNQALAEMPSKSRVLILIRQGQMTRFYSLKVD